MTLPEHPIPDSYWASPGRLLAGPRPGGTDRALQRARLQRLVECGVRTLIDLTTPADAEPLRVPWERRAPAGEAHGWVNVPLTDGGTPTEAWMLLVLDLIDASLARERPVYVHCLGGLGRTGTVTACWLIRHAHVSPQEVIDRLSLLRQGQPSAHRPSPETAGQRAFVRAWRPGR